MPKYVVFAGGSGGIPNFHETLGCFKTLSILEILAGTVEHEEIFKPKDIDLRFPHDPKIKDLLLGMDLPERYTAYRAQVLNEPELLRIADQCCNKFGLKHKIYET